MAFKNAPAAWMNGVTVATADIEALAITGAKVATGTITTTQIANSTVVGGDIATGTIANANLAGSIANNKLAAPNALTILNFNQPTPVAANGVAGFQCYGAMTILEVGAMYGTAPTSGTAKVDVHAGPNVASCATILASALTVSASALKPTVAAPSGTKGVRADNDFIRFDVDYVGSGTKANLSGWIVLKAAHSA